MEKAMTTHQVLLVAIGVAVVLLSVVLQTSKRVTTPAKTRKLPVVCGLAVAMICFFGPPLLRWLGNL